MRGPISPRSEVLKCLLSLVLLVPLGVGVEGVQATFEALLRALCSGPECTLLHCGASDPSGCCEHRSQPPGPSLDEETAPCNCCSVSELPTWPDRVPAPAPKSHEVEALKKASVLPGAPFWVNLGALSGHAPLVSLEPPGRSRRARDQGQCARVPCGFAAKGPRISAFLGRALN
jgi:hypothetical protein